MNKKKQMEELSSRELYTLALKREREEREQERRAYRERVRELRARRRQLVAEHRKELAKIDAEIRAMVGGSPKGGGPRVRGVSAAVVEIVGKRGEVSRKELQAKLESRGIVAANLNQTLAYLKRQGRISSPRRGVYGTKR